MSRDEHRQRARLLARDAGHPRERSSPGASALGGAAGWVALSLAIALALLGAVWVVAGLLTPDITPIHLPGLTEPSTPATCCRSSGATRWSWPCTRPPASPASSPAPRCRSPPPSAAASRAGSTSRRASWRSSSSARSPSSRSRTQALYLGFQGSTIAYQLQISHAALILSVLPHAIPELTALFLPLAAWLIASRRGEWNQLLAATFITVADRDPRRSSSQRRSRSTSGPTSSSPISPTCSESGTSALWPARVAARRKLESSPRPALCRRCFGAAGSCRRSLRLRRPWRPQHAYVVRRELHAHSDTDAAREERRPGSTAKLQWLPSPRARSVAWQRRFLVRTLRPGRIAGRTVPNGRILKVPGLM